MNEKRKRQNDKRSKRESSRVLLAAFRFLYLYRSRLWCGDGLGEPIERTTAGSHAELWIQHRICPVKSHVTPLAVARLFLVVGEPAMTKFIGWERGTVLMVRQSRLSVEKVHKRHTCLPLSRRLEASTREANE